MSALKPSGEEDKKPCTCPITAAQAPPAAEVRAVLESLATGDTAEGPLLPPVEPHREVRAGGVTYGRSREAREPESTDADAYARVYDAERPELFFGAGG